MSVAALEFATPAALWALGVAAPLVAAHLYFRKRRVRPVPFLGLLQESLGPIRRQARFKKLYDALALACRLIALACLVLALAGLRPAVARPDPEDVVFVLDADITTAAKEADGRVRFAHGLELLRAHVRALPATPEGFDDRVAIVRAGRVPSMLLRPTRDRDAAVAALREVAGPEAARGDLQAAIRMALHVLEDAPRARVVVVTARGIPETELPAHRRLQAIGTGRARNDQTISGFALEMRPDGLQYRCRVQVRNDADGERVRTLRARLGTLPVAERVLTLPAAEETNLSFKLDAPAVGRPLVVELMDDDDFPVGDRVHAWLPPGVRPRVLVVHEDGLRPYTAAALTALADQIDQTRSGAVTVRDLPQAEPRHVTVVDGVGLPALRPGAYVFLAPFHGGALPFEIVREVRDPLVWRKSERDHPLTRDLDFATAFAVRGWTLKGEGLRPLAYVEGEPVVAYGSRGDVRYVVLALDPRASSLPLQKTFPLLLRNAIRFLTSVPRAPVAPVYDAGTSLRPHVALSGGPLVHVRWDGWGRDDLIGGDGDTRTVRVAPTGGTWSIPPGAVGPAEITTGPADAREVVARTSFLDLDPTRTVVPVHVRQAPPPPAQVRAPRERRWRTGLIALAALFLLLDLALLRPRRRAAVA